MAEDSRSDLLSLKTVATAIVCSEKYDGHHVTKTV